MALPEVLHRDLNTRLLDALEIVENLPTDLTRNLTRNTTTHRAPRLYQTPSAMDIPLSDIQPVTAECNLYFYNGDLDPPQLVSSNETEPVVFRTWHPGNTFVEVHQINGVNFATDIGDFTVKLEVLGGDPGTASTKCAFRYRVFSADGSFIDLDSDNNPDSTSGTGLIARPDLGEHKAATTGRAHWNAFNSLVIVSLDEVDVRSVCESSILANSIFAGEYDSSRSYDTNQWVTDSRWTMIANSPTSQKAAPQPTGPQRWRSALDDTPAWTIVSGPGTSVWTGQRYTFSTTGYITSYRVWLPVTGSANQVYDIWMVTDPTGSPQWKMLIQDHEAVSVAWLEIPLGGKIYDASTVIDFVLISRRVGTSVVLTANWDYSIASTVPALGDATQTSNGTTIQINHEDDGGTDRQAALESLAIGETFTMGGVTYTILDSTTGASVHTFDVLPAVTATAGVLELVFSDITSGTLDYVQLANHFIADSEVDGIKSTTGYPNVVTDDDSYGMDIEVTDAIISSDWDFIAFNGDREGLAT